jgi:outer membrane protein TolC
MNKIRQKILIILLFPLMLQAQDITNITMLFDSLKLNPHIKSSDILLERALLGKSMANSKLFPKLDVFGSYDYATTPSGMLPVAPNDLFQMIKDPTIPQPFSQNILRAGAAISLPVFVKSIYTMASKAKMMYQSAEVKKEIDLLKNEAIIVSSNANLQYMDALQKALEKKKVSLEKVRELVTMKVDNGRAPESALLKINTGINEVDLMRNEVALNKEKAISTIYSLTNVTLDKPLKMEQTGDFAHGELRVLEPLKKKIDATQLGVRAEKEKLYPALVLHGAYNHSYAKAYNNDLSVNEDYATVGLTLRIPIFEKDQYTKIKQSKLDVMELENELDQMRMDFSAQAQQLESSLKILETSIDLYKSSIKDKEQLLEVAKVAYNTDRMTIEDYMKYEDDLLLEKSRLYKAQAQKWQTLMKLAVIYGNNIENMVK